MRLPTDEEKRRVDAWYATGGEDVDKWRRARDGTSAENDGESAGAAASAAAGAFSFPYIYFCQIRLDRFTCRVSCALTPTQLRVARLHMLARITLPPSVAMIVASLICA